MDVVFARLEESCTDLVHRAAPFNAVLASVGGHQYTVAAWVAGDVGREAKKVKADEAAVVPRCRTVTRAKG